MNAIVRLAPLLCLLGLAHAAGATSSVRILATDPPDGRDLPPGETLFVRIGYASDEPVRFQVKGLLGGSAPGATAHSNPAPVYPAGEGEAIAWIRYMGPALIDEIVVETSTHAWVRLDEARHPLDVEWRTGATRASTATWVVPLSDAQQQMTRESLAQLTEGSDAWDWVILLMGWAVPAYFILQGLLWWRWHGGWRRAALVPLWGAVPVVAYTLFALFMGSNLWPLVMLFTLPLGFAYLVALIVLRRLMRKSRL
jgi:hypothetical protein